ncbi:hypothetical protein [Gynuella sp.]|uniref:hypothetical protein n=1 Tax=Gynuella sp. TaxID=2969146 RepID=UPI003D10FBD3
MRTGILVPSVLLVVLSSCNSSDSKDSSTSPPDDLYKGLKTQATVTSENYQELAAAARYGIEYAIVIGDLFDDIYSIAEDCQQNGKATLKETAKSISVSFNNCSYDSRILNGQYVYNSDVGKETEYSDNMVISWNNEKYQVQSVYICQADEADKYDDNYLCSDGSANYVDFSKNGKHFRLEHTFRQTVDAQNNQWDASATVYAEPYGFILLNTNTSPTLCNGGGFSSGSLNTQDTNGWGTLDVQFTDPGCNTMTANYHGTNNTLVSSTVNQ